MCALRLVEVLHMKQQGLPLLGHRIQEQLELWRGQLQDDCVALRHRSLAAPDEAVPDPRLLPHLLDNEPLQDVHDEADHPRVERHGLDHGAHEEQWDSGLLHQLL